MLKQFVIALGLSAMVVASASGIFSANARVDGKVSVVKQASQADELHLLGLEQSVGARSPSSH